MNVGSLSCYIMALLFYIISLILVLMKEKGIKLIAGFNSLPKNEQDNYDKAKIVLSVRIDTQSWATLFLMGGVVSMMVSQWISIIVFIIWLVLFFKDFKLDAKKAYEKYRIK